jgi:hypothetical protein
MENPFIDFLIGLTVANSIPHFLVGAAGIRFLGMFGYGNKANMAYSLFSIIVSLILFHINYGITSIFEMPMYVGALFVAVSYVFGSHILVKLFAKRPPTE